jgi:uroporphyrinogen-III decarboxylase
MAYPEFARRVNGRLEGDAPGAGGEYIFHDERTFEDPWGIVFRVGEDGKYLQWKHGPLHGKDSLRGWSPPSVVYPSVEEVATHLAPWRGFVTVTEIESPFKLAWHLCGLEDFLLAMIANPGMVEALYDQLYAFQTAKAVLAARAGYDVIAVVGDVAGQLGMMFSPELFNRYDVPRLTEMVAKVKQSRPQAKLLYHSDGNMEAIIPALIRCGIDILNPIQSACMDPAAIKREYGAELTLHGTISVQDTIPDGSVEDVRNEVVTRIRTVGYNGGFIISPENSIPYDAPLANVLALFETALQFDYSTLRIEAS